MEAVEPPCPARASQGRPRHLDGTHGKPWRAQQGRSDIVRASCSEDPCGICVEMSWGRQCWQGLEGLHTVKPRPWDPTKKTGVLN